MHELRGLFARTAKQERATCGMNLVGKFLDGAKTGGINSGHVAEPKNNYGGQIVHLSKNPVKLVCSAKKKRTVNAKHCRIGRDVLALKDVNAAVGHVITRHPRDGCGPRNFADEGERRKHHADFNRESKVG